MRAIEFISELRRNPEQNAARDRGYKSVLAILRGQDLENIGISMTELPKLGINPKSAFDTPIGIYFYPAYYFLQEAGNVPFQEKAPYIQIFEFSKGNILDLANYNDSDFDRDLNRLVEVYPNLADNIREFAANAEKAAKVKSLPGFLWYVTYELSQYLSFDPTKQFRFKSKYKVHTPTSSIKWNSIFRQLGYDAIIDDGEGIIHENEPTQGVIINPRIVKMIKTIDNKVGAKHYDEIGRLILDPNPNFFVRRVGRMAVDDPKFLQPETTPSFLPNYVRRTPGRIYRVFSKFVEVLRNDPELLDELSNEQRAAVLKIAPAKLKPIIQQLFTKP